MWPQWHITVGLLLTLLGTVITAESYIADLRDHPDPNNLFSRIGRAVATAWRGVFARWLPPPLTSVTGIASTGWATDALTVEMTPTPDTTDEWIAYLREEVQKLNTRLAAHEDTLRSLREADSATEASQQQMHRHFTTEIRNLVVQRVPGQLISLFLLAVGAVFLTIPNHGHELSWLLTGNLAMVIVLGDLVGYQVLGHPVSLITPHPCDAPLHWWRQTCVSRGP